jgi:hypothetical protein
MLAGNASRRLCGFAGKAAAAALSLADHLGALLAGGDAVAVTFEDFLRDPSNDGCGILAPFELLLEFCFEFLDIRHGSFVVG